jgi:hypothetical protein
VQRVRRPRAEVQRPDKDVWRGVSRARRRRIVRAVRRGELLTDPEDAALAVRLAAGLRHRGRKFWLDRAARLLVVALLVWQNFYLLRGLHGYVVPSASVVFALFWLAIETYGVVQGLRDRPAVATAEQRNREFLAAIRHPDATYGVESSAARRDEGHELLKSFACSAGCLVCFVVVAALPVMNDRGSTLRLVVFAAVAVVAIALSLLGVRFARRAWNDAQRGGSKLVPGFAFAVAFVTLVAWIVGAINVLFFGG